MSLICDNEVTVKKCIMQQLRKSRTEGNHVAIYYFVIMAEITNIGIRRG